MIGSLVLYTLHQSVWGDWSQLSAGDLATTIILGFGPALVFVSFVAVPLLFVNYLIGIIPTFLFWRSLKRKLSASMSEDKAAGIAGLATTLFALILLYVWFGLAIGGGTMDWDGLNLFAVLAGSFSLLVAPFAAQRAVCVDGG